MIWNDFSLKIDHFLLRLSYIFREFLNIWLHISKHKSMHINIIYLLVLKLFNFRSIFTSRLKVVVEATNANKYRFRFWIYLAQLIAATLCISPLINSVIVHFLGCGVYCASERPQILDRYQVSTFLNRLVIWLMMKKMIEIDKMKNLPNFYPIPSREKTFNFSFLHVR